MSWQPIETAPKTALAVRENYRCRRCFAGEMAGMCWGVTFPEHFERKRL